MDDCIITIIDLVPILYLGCIYLNDVIVMHVFIAQAYLEDFHRFCQQLGGTTADVMGSILEVLPPCVCGSL